MLPHTTKTLQHKKTLFMLDYNNWARLWACLRTQSIIKPSPYEQMTIAAHRGTTRFTSSGDKCLIYACLFCICHITSSHRPPTHSPRQKYTSITAKKASDRSERLLMEKFSTRLVVQLNYACTIRVISSLHRKKQVTILQNIFGLIEIR